MKIYGFAAVLLISATAAGAADVKRGKELHDAHCTSCHIGMTGGDGSLIYTRKDHRVTSLKALDTQVRRCENSQGLKWFDDELADVIAYLNKTYYKFPAN